MDDEPAADRAPGMLPDIAARPPRPWWAVWLLALAAVVLIGAVLLGMAAVYYLRYTAVAYHGGYWHRPISASGTELTWSEVADARVVCGWLIRLTTVVGVVGVFLLIAGAIAWFRWQFSLRTLMLLVTAFALACSLLATLNRHPKRYLNHMSWCQFGGETLLLHSTYWEEEFLYGFVTRRGLDATATTDRPDTPAPVGVHWWINGPDGLWFNGKKVAIPAASPVFAILDDGCIVPILSTDAQREIITGPLWGDWMTGEITDPQAKQNLTAPFGRSGGTPGAERRKPP